MQPTLILRKRLTDLEREALIADGALVCTPTGKIITAQKDFQAKNMIKLYLLYEGMSQKKRNKGF